MNIFKIILTSEQICGNNEGAAIVLSISPGFQYTNGEKTDVVDHLKFTCIFPDNQYEKMTVKVQDLKCSATAEKVNAAGGQLKVKFKNLSGKLYRSNTGEVLISASADGVEVIA